MHTIGISMLKDEADIVEATVGHMLGQVDAVIVADNNSTDDTREILDKLAAVSDGRLLVVDDPDPAYRQSEKMTALALRARLEFGAEWLIPFDADEWWYSPFGRIADVLGEVWSQWLVAPATVYDHMATAVDVGVTPVERMIWRRFEHLPLPKVACRWREDLIIQQGNHGATYRGEPTVRPDRLLIVRHFPYRSVEQFVRKVRNGAAAYRAMADVPAAVGAHWRQWGDLLDQHGEQVLVDIFHTWYWRDDPTVGITVEGTVLQPLVRDPVGVL